MNKLATNLILLVPPFLWAAYGCSYVFSDYTMQASTHGAVWMAAGTLLVLVCLVCCVVKRIRKVAVVALLIVISSTVVGRRLRAARLEAGVRQIEAIYLDLAKAGPPFPQAIDRSQYENPSFLHWYYQQNSPESFSVVYLVLSDGWAMEYPQGTWRWIGYWPHGYDPKEIGSAEFDGGAARMAVREEFAQWLVN
jgi:hypothetical protein